MHLNNECSGYDRLQVFQIGAGATEIIWPTFQSLNGQKDNHIDGKIEAVFDRTVHISLSIDPQSKHSSLIVLGKENVRKGPLLMQVSTPTGFSFNNRLSGGSSGVDLRLLANGSTLQMDMGHGLNVLLDISQMSMLPACGGIYDPLKIEEFQFGSNLVTLNKRLIEYLDDQGLEDGLGWLNEIGQFHSGDTSQSLDNLVDSIHSVLTVNGFDSDLDTIRSCELVPQPVIELLGCGPGATPSGDDILLGIFLILQRIDNSNISKSAEIICKQVSQHANSMTTQMSSSLLEQVWKKRAAKPAIECSRTMTDPTASQHDMVEGAKALIETGHTSGLDSLIGMLITTTVILPKLNSSS